MAHDKTSPITPISGQTQLELNAQMSHAMDIMENTDQCCFITGKAGTGKSTLLHFFARKSGKSPVILAPTGVSALNVGGQTLHRFFHFPRNITPEEIEKGEIKVRNPKIYQKLRMIIIDEVSMLRADLLDCIDTFLRHWGPQPGQSFGGVQMIFMGDLYQLPPVVKRDEMSFFQTHYDSPYFLSSHSLKSIDLTVMELIHIYRQKDNQFIDLLNKVRINRLKPEDFKKLNGRFKGVQTAPKGTIHLTATNQQANEINDHQLHEINQPLRHHEAKIQGNFSPDYYPTLPQLSYKKGAQIMMLNNDSKKRWVNGSLGQIMRAPEESSNQPLSVYLHHNQKTVHVHPFTWEVFTCKIKDQNLVHEVAGSFCQYPFRLAWAVTVHKSQGQTFENVVIDLGPRSFASGQAYVALSRCVRLEGMTLTRPLNSSHIRLDPRLAHLSSQYGFNRPDAHSARID